MGVRRVGGGEEGRWGVRRVGGGVRRVGGGGGEEGR